jgi:hypothetical protein
MQRKTDDPRIARLFSGDRFWSYSALALLWLLYAFVFYSMQPYIQEPETFWLLVTGGGLVLLFNTAAILVMIAHLSEDREEIYGLDLYYVDEAKAK